MPPVSRDTKSEASKALNAYLSRNAWRHTVFATTSQFNHLRRTSLDRYNDATTQPPFIFPHLYRNASASDLLHHYPGELYAENLLIVAAEFPITAVQQKTNHFKRRRLSRDLDLMTLRKRIGNTCDQFSAQNGFEAKGFREGFWTIATRVNGLTCGVTFWQYAEQQLSAKVGRDIAAQAIHRERLVFAPPVKVEEQSLEPEARPFIVQDDAANDVQDFGGLLESAAEYLNTSEPPDSPDDAIDGDAEMGFLESAAAYLNTSPPERPKDSHTHTNGKYDPAKILAKARRGGGRKPTYVVPGPVYEHSLPRDACNNRYGRELGTRSLQETHEQIGRWRSARGVD